MFDIKELEPHNLENEILTSEFKCYTVPEVAKLLGFSKSYVYDLINTHKLKSIKFSPRRTRIPKSAFKEFIKQGMDKPIPNNNAVQPPKRGRKYNGTVQK